MAVKENRNLGLGRRSDTEKRSILKRFESSGLTQTEFCRREGVSTWTLREWQKRFSGEESAELFFEVGAKDVGCFELEHRGVRVKVPAEFRPEALQLLLRTIGEVKC